MLELREVGRSALLGTVVTAFAQGVLGAVGFAIAGVPRAISWGLVTAVASFVPVVGTAIVWAPMSVYHLLRGEVMSAALLFSWGAVLVVGLGDYFVRPWFVGRQGKGQPLLMLVSRWAAFRCSGWPVSSWVPSSCRSSWQSSTSTSARWNRRALRHRPPFRDFHDGPLRNQAERRSHSRQGLRGVGLPSCGQTRRGELP